MVAFTWVPTVIRSFTKLFALDLEWLHAQGAGRRSGGTSSSSFDFFVVVHLNPLILPHHSHGPPSLLFYFARSLTWSESLCTQATLCSRYDEQLLGLDSGAWWVATATNNCCCCCCCVLKVIIVINLNGEERVDGPVVWEPRLPSGVWYLFHAISSP